MCGLASDREVHGHQGLEEQPAGVGVMASATHFPSRAPEVSGRCRREGGRAPGGAGLLRIRLCCRAGGQTARSRDRRWPRRRRGANKGSPATPLREGRGSVAGDQANAAGAADRQHDLGPPAGATSALPSTSRRSTRWLRHLQNQRSLAFRPRICDLVQSVHGRHRRPEHRTRPRNRRCRPQACDRHCPRDPRGFPTCVPAANVAKPGDRRRPLRRDWYRRRWRIQAGTPGPSGAWSRQ